MPSSAAGACQGLQAELDSTCKTGVKPSSQEPTRRAPGVPKPSVLGAAGIFPAGHCRPRVCAQHKAEPEVKLPAGAGACGAQMSPVGTGRSEHTASKGPLWVAVWAVASLLLTLFPSFNSTPEVPPASPLPGRSEGLCPFQVRPAHGHCTNVAGPATGLPQLLPACPSCQLGAQLLPSSPQCRCAASG